MRYFVWTGEGECKRCGKCCRGHGSSPEDLDCEYLRWDAEHKAVCTAPVKPEGCATYPIPNARYLQVWPTCGFKFREVEE